MKITTIKLGTECKDKATELVGTVTHWLLDMGLRVDYVFQPLGLNPENGQPVDKLVIEKERLIYPADGMEEVDVPFEILGTVVTNKSSGFHGMAVGFVCHLNGCLHIVIQPPGTLPKTNSPIRKAEFDIRECRGEKIPEPTPSERKKSTKENPSPTGDRFEEYMPTDQSVPEK
jgi:hypothetical protein